MALISTRQYDRAIRFFTEAARKIRTCPPVRILRCIHAQSFAETQRAQAGVECQDSLQQRSRVGANSPKRTFPAGDRLLQLGAWRDRNASQPPSKAPNPMWQRPQPNAVDDSDRPGRL
ncbi:hypothetical protein [Synechococcus sp. PCC 7336]|uniref:hypothetical protein n=1 Tax=Synechococcus sp. PCC 7336 TaxID=195250 RepID=UPI0012E9BA3B|nr:hypothetical protein [Synechococcus sp. PCC 7336]